MKTSYSYLLVAGLLASASGSAFAQTWDGDTSTDFSTGANWDSGVAPNGTAAFTINNVSAATAFAPILTTAYLLDPDGAGGDGLVGNGAGGVGTLDINAGGSLDGSGNWLFIGQGGGTGTVNVNTGGTLTSDNEIRLGNGGGTGTLNIDGGSLLTQAWLPVGINTDSVGTLNLISGVVNVNQGAGGTTIGTDNATGVVNMSGGTWTSANEGILLGENGTGNGTFNLDGGIVTTTRFRVTVSAAATGTLNLNGGTLSTGSMEIGAGTTTVNLNGTPITANADSTAFFAGGETNLLADTTFDTAGFNVSGNSDFIGSANIIKNGAGNLGLLSDGHELTGNIIINAGVLTLGANGVTDPYAGQISVADGAGFGVRTIFFGDEFIEPTDLSFAGASTTFNVDLGNADFFTSSDPIILVDGGSFNVSGDITVNISGQDVATGNYVLIDYGSTKVGTANWILGTLPTGITSPDGIVDTGSTIEIGLIAPAVEWDGSTNENWDSTTENWVIPGTLTGATFSPGDVAIFNDNAITTNVVTAEDVAPSLVRVENGSVDYTLTAGAGVITGGTGLTKLMDGNLTITGMANTYTGITTLAGGTTTVDVLTNGGVASPLGAASSDPSNLILSGGTLSYTGAATTTDRSFTIAANDSGISLQNSLTLSSGIVSTGGNIIKSGPGDLILTNAGTNAIGVASPGLRVREGSVNFTGSGTQIMNIGGNLVVGDDAAFAGNTLFADTTMNVGNNLIVGIGATGTATLNGGTLNTVDEIFVGEGAGGNGTLDITAGTVNADNWIAVGRNGSTGVMNIDGGTVNVAITDGGNFFAIGSDLGAGAGNGTVNQNGGIVNCPGAWMGEGGDSIAQYFLNAGDFNCTQDAVIIGKQGNGTATFTNNGGTAIITGNVVIADLDTSSGTLALNGGTLRTNNVVAGTSTGTSTLSFDGGTLIAGESNATFINGLTSCVVEAGGGTINTGTFSPIVPQTIRGTGPLSKAGLGVLTLSGTNTHSGDLVIVQGAVTTTSTTTLHASSGVNVKTGGTLNLDFTGDQFVERFFINDVAQMDGTYPGGSTTGLSGTGNLVVQPFVDPYQTWIEGFFPGETDPNIIGKDADPDRDGQPNNLEFALGGLPNDGGNNAKVYVINQVDRLLLTIAVLEGTPAFAGSPSPTATIDDSIYTIVGSDDLVDLTSNVSVAAVDTTGIPPTPPAGYVYQTFQLDSSIDFPDKGFLWVEVTP